jgi:hypothetical protein
LVKAGHVGLDGSGSEIINDDAPVAKKRKMNRYAGYTDAVWGVKTRGWAAAATRLDDIKWRTVLHAAVDEVDWTADDGDVEEGTGGGAWDPRSMIEIW